MKEEIKLKELRKGYCNAWNDSDFASMVRTVKPIAWELGAALHSTTPPRGSQGGLAPSWRLWEKKEGLCLPVYYKTPRTQLCLLVPRNQNMVDHLDIVC